MENKYLKSVSSLIQNKNARHMINYELESHILDKTDYYIEIGYSYDEAIRRATEEMGNPDDTAVPLNVLHSDKRYKNVWNIITVLFTVFIMLLSANIIPVEHNFHYAAYSYCIVHRILFDFLSLLIFSMYIILLYKSHRQKNSFISAMIILSLVFMIAFNLFNLNGYTLEFALFQPLIFSVVTIASGGVKIYADSIFSYSYIPDNLKDFYVIGENLLFIILLVLSVLLFVSIIRQQRLKTVRIPWKILKIVERVILIMFATNFAVMFCATVSALINFDTKNAEIQTIKESQINYVINADLSLGSEEHINRLIKLGYEKYFNDDNIWQSGQATLHYGNDSNIIILPYNNSPNSLSENYISYGTTTIGSPFVAVNDNLYLTNEEMAWIKANMTLDEFLQLGWYNKAIFVSHYKYDSVSQESVDFMFALNTHSDYKSIFYTFTNMNGVYTLTGQSQSDFANSDEKSNTNENSLLSYIYDIINETE